MKISVIVPVFNEEKTIIELLTKVNKQNTENFSLEVIVVNDCSTDNSGELIQENEELYSQYIELSQNMGKGGAVREALISASGEYVLFQDADLEYNPEDYKNIFTAIKNYNPDVVIGSRFLSPQYTRVHYYFHKVGNKVITFLFNLLYNSTFTDIYSCYLCFRRTLIDPKKLKSNGWDQQAEILATVVKKSNVHYEVPISYSGRTFDEGKKIKGRHIFKVIMMIFKKRLL
tara:strand:+ start:513 stop:1202 length:690 start_codon:yes stop_codon:yes gene_type:complete